MIEVPANPVPAGLASRVRFAVAGQGDDDSIRRLLRTNPMAGVVQLTFEREPDCFRSDGMAGASDRTIVAYDHDRLVCMGKTNVRPRFINGRVARVGYLGELRLDISARGRFDILRRGYRFFRELEESSGGESPELWFTSIVSDNHRSLRFLERNLPGMPRYTFLSGFVTMLIPVPRSLAVAKRRAATIGERLARNGYQVKFASVADLPAISSLLNECGVDTQFAAEWTPNRLGSLRELGLGANDWLCIGNESQLVACSALWDQRGFRQTVIRGYAPPLSTARPLLNLLSPLLGRSPLPSPDTILAHAFLSPMAMKGDNDSLVADLVELSLADARRRGLEFLTLGLPSGHASLLALRRRFSCREYRSRLYQVSWTDGAEVRFKNQEFAPEVSLL
jgi:hypothetical protein